MNVRRSADVSSITATPWREVAWRDSSEALLVVNSITDKIIDANPAFELLLDSTLGYILGAEYTFFIELASSAKFRKPTSTADTLPFNLMGVPLNCPSGTKRLVDVHVVPSRDATGGPIWLCRVRDTVAAGSSAELRRLNWALEAYARSSKALLRHDDIEDLVTRICEAIVENDIYALSFMGLCEPSPDKTLRVVAGAGRAIGYMEGLKISWSEDIPEGQGATGTAIRSGVPSIVQDTMTDPAYAPWREKGLHFGIRSSVSVPFEQKDKIIGALNVYAVRPHAFGPKEIGVFSQLGRDIAFAISIEEERVRLEAAERARSAAEAELQRVARISTIGEFTASIAHELNQPLTAIAANCNASLRWLEKEPAELDEARASIRRTVSDAHRASGVINRMAPLLRKDEPKYVDLDLNEVIKEVLTFTRGEQRRSQITVHSELLAGLQPVRGDRIQLQQVMLNLILNAIEAMRDVVDRARLLQIQTSIGATGDAVVEVKDSGTGLDAAVMHRIFDRFFTTKAGGTGLGLPICRSIIEAQGGRLWATPNEPRGAVFQFTLPPCRTD